MKEILAQLAAMQVKMPIESILLTLSISIVMSLVIYFTYKFTFNGVLYSQKFNISIVMITLITTIVMVVISSNISVSLGMVGALSIVRFRTAVKDPRDTAFIFWAVVVGLACGTQNYHIAVIGSLVVCIVLFIFRGFMFKEDKYVLIIKGDNLDAEKVEQLLNSSTKHVECKGKYINNGSTELIYNVRFKDKMGNDVVETLKTTPGVKIVNLVKNSTETMG